MLLVAIVRRTHGIKEAVSLILQNFVVSWRGYANGKRKKHQFICNNGKLFQFASLYILESGV